MRGALHSEDTEVMANALRTLGFRVLTDWPNGIIHVGHEEGQLIPATGAELFVANSGTTMRFLTALVSLGQGRFRLDGVAQMRERPIEDLLPALRQLGVDARSEGGNGCPPVLIHANGLRGGHVAIKGNVSSQFLSGLLMAASAATNDAIIEVEGDLVSSPYVAMTVHMMRRLGLANRDARCGARFHVPGNQHSGLMGYTIEPDASAASYFWAPLPSPAVPCTSKA